MRTVKIATNLLLIWTIFGPGFVHAQTWNSYCDYAGGDVISAFTVSVSVNTDNSINVEEMIDFVPCSGPKHGIYRDINLRSSENRRMKIENISVTDLEGSPYKFQEEMEGDSLRLRIGDPSTTFSTVETYVLRYRATSAIAHLDNVDEIYWNITGDNWDFPIRSAVASVALPAGAAPLMSACYYGLRGSVDQCEIYEESGATFYKATNLEPGEGLTIAVGFEKGLVAPYEKTLLDWPYLPLVLGILLPVLTLALSLWYWHVKGRDPKGRGVLVPEYDMIDGLSPMETAGIALEKVSTEHLGAELIYLATEGFIRINEVEKKYAGVIRSKDYELVLLKDMNEARNDFQRKLLFYLFNTPKTFSLGHFFKREIPKPANSHTVKLSELKNKFHQSASEVVTLALGSLVSKGYYKNLGRMKNPGLRWFSIIFLAFFGSASLYAVMGSLFFGKYALALPIGAFLSMLIFGIVSHFSPAKTEKGVVIKEHILGLREYLRIAEKDRLNFHNAPDKKPEVFEKLLPFAMVLGVADIWAREFEGIYTKPPSWYEGTDHDAFNSVDFNNSMSSFKSFAASSLASAPSGGGSGGGGFSGGGGGGGGGGSW